MSGRGPRRYKIDENGTIKKYYDNNLPSTGCGILNLYRVFEQMAQGKF